MEFLLLAAAGFVAGIVNAVAGGGTFFTFAALVAVGLPSLQASATSAVALTPGSLATAAAYRAEMRAYPGEMLAFGAIGAVGGLCGALILIGIGDEGFRPLVPWLLAAATLLFALSGIIRPLLARVGRSNGWSAQLTAYLIMAVSSVYGGFFGAGMGIVMLAGLALVSQGDFHKANAIKNLVGMLTQALAIVLFIAGGLVHWGPALVTMVAGIAGGYLGVRIARGVPEPIVRGAVVAAGTVLSLVFFLR